MAGNSFTSTIRHYYNYLFAFSKNNLLVLELLLLFFLVHHLTKPFPFLPCIVRANNDFPSLVGGVLSTILGIVIAFIIVSFEFSRKYYPKSSTKFLLGSRYLKEFLYLYLGTILLAGYLSLSQEYLDPAQSNNLLWLNFLLFLLSLMILVPSIKQFIKTSKYEHIESLITSVEGKHLLLENWDTPDKYFSFTTKFEDNPVYEFAQSCEINMREGDTIFPRIVIDKLMFRFENALEYFTEKHKVMNSILLFSGKIRDTALATEDYETLKILLSELIALARIHPHNKLKNYGDVFRKSEDFLFETGKIVVNKGVGEVLEFIIQIYIGLIKYRLGIIYRIMLSKEAGDPIEEYFGESERLIINHINKCNSYLMDIYVLLFYSINRDTHTETIERCFYHLDTLKNEIIENEYLDKQEKKELVRSILWKISELSIHHLRRDEKNEFGSFPIVLNDPFNKMSFSLSYLSLKEYTKTSLEFLKMKRLKESEIRELG